MKKLAIFALLAGALVPIAKADSVPPNSNVTLQSSAIVSGILTQTKTVDLDLNYNRVDFASVQVNYSSTTQTPVTFTDGFVSTGNLTVSNLTSLTTAFATEKITVSQTAAVASTDSVTIISTTGLSGQTITLGGKVFTADLDFPTSGISTGNVAVELAAILNNTTLFLATSNTTGNVVIATAEVAGVAGNLFNCVSSSPTVMSCNGPLFAGGVNNSLQGAVLTVVANGYLNYPQANNIVLGPQGSITATLTQGQNWQIADVSSNTALNINAALNGMFQGGTTVYFNPIFVSTVQPGSAIIYSTASTVGSFANAWTVTSSTPTALTVGTANFTGGQDNAVIKIAGYPLVANTDYTVFATTGATAVSISSAINNISSQTPYFTSILISTVQPSTNIVYTTSTVVGAWTNFSLFSSTPTALKWSGPFMSSGTNSDIAYGIRQNSNVGFLSGNFYPNGPVPTNVINKATVNWGVGTQVLLTKTAGTYPIPLLNNTTYWIASVSSNTSFQLIDTSTGLAAGLTLNFATSTLTGGGQFTLTPLAFGGGASFKLQYSNDDVNFVDVFISTNALAQPITSSTTWTAATAPSTVLWNLNKYENGSLLPYRWLRFIYTAAGQGSSLVQYLINALKDTQP